MKSFFNPLSELFTKKLRAKFGCNLRCAQHVMQGCSH